MAVTVELTYDMSKELGEARFQVEAASVGDAVERTKERFGAKAEAFDQLGRVVGIAVNGVLVSHRKGLRTPLEPGDVVSFVKAAAGG